MTNDEMNIAVAEVRGWTKCRLAVRGSGAPERGPSPYGIPPGRSYEAPVHDYGRDLNAMHEAEKALKGAAIYSYFDRLVGEIAGSCSDPRHCDYPKVVSATAAQRREAFLKTIGKWKEPVP